MALASDARRGFWPSMRHVGDGTIGFTVLLVLIGFGLQTTVSASPSCMSFLQWSGVVLQLYIAYALATDSGDIGSPDSPRAPASWLSAEMQ